jgi:carboxyl-terminal processing protease
MIPPSAIPRLKVRWIFLVMFVAHISCAQEAAKPREPQSPAAAKIVQDVVKAIDDHYLRAQANPLWNIAKDALLTAKYHDASEAFLAIQKQLPTLEDYELNLLSPAQVSAVQAEATGQSIGLGLCDFCLDLEVGTGRARVVTPLAGSPAMVKGIEPRDVIVSINDKPTSDMNHEQVADALRTPISGGSRLQIQRGERTLHFVLQLASEKLQPLRSEVKKINGRSIGYIRVTLFTPELATLAHDAIARLEESGVEGYVLDLRSNPGGFLNAATALAGMFVNGTLGFKVNSSKKKDPIEATGTPLTRKPLAVLINEGTASASEFLSSGLKGLHRAQLVGMHTYGRGQAQIFFPLAEDYGIQIPSVQFLTTDEQSYKGKGIAPDIEVKQTQLQESQLAGPTDRQFLRAAQSLSTP